MNRVRRFFWKSPCGRVVVIEHSAKKFELFLDSVAVMPPGSFEAICRYIWLEILETEPEEET